MRVVTFNAQNLRLRQTPDGPRLDGARDRDVDQPEDRDLDLRDRRLTAAVLARIGADVVCLQEVFDQATLDHFHDAFLVPAGAAPYAHRVCLPGNDGHGLNVALMARFAPDTVVSHADARAEDLGLEDREDVLHGQPVFRRDCLEVRFGALAVFVCHLKAPYPDRARAQAIRTLEAAAIRRIVEAACPDPSAALWLIAGDLNTPVRSGFEGDNALAPLLDGFAVDLMDRLPAGEDWTFRMPDSGETLRPDALLASPSLARGFPRAVPVVERIGMEPRAGRAAGSAFAGVGRPRPHASDHAAVWIDLGDVGELAIARRG